MLQPALPISADLKSLAKAGLRALDAVDHHVPLTGPDAGAAQSLVTAALQTEAATDKPLLSFLAPRPPADMVIMMGLGIQTLLHSATAR